MITSYELYISLNLCSLQLSCLLLIVSIFTGDFKQRIYRCFFLLVLLNLGGLLFEMAMGMMIGHTGDTINVLIKVLECISYAVGGLQMVVFAVYLYEYLSTKIRLKRHLFLILATYGVMYTIFVSIASFNNIFVSFDIYNRQIRQDTFWISSASGILFLFICMLITLYYVKVLKKREWISLLFYAIIPIIFYVNELLTPGIYMGYLAASVTLFMIYINIQIEMKQQIIENRIAVIISQIQPHFLCNTLSTIDDLFYENPEVGHKAVLDFSNYLRGNMSSLSQKELILFEKELEHTERYLRLEKLRFNDRLQIVYDIQTVDFLLPTLTLQPIVENAVRYGVTKKKSGGTVTIRSEETVSGYRITVNDDGVGFNLQEVPVDDRSHIGIMSVRTRLALMCKGKLTIESKVGFGTSVIIEIPKRKEHSK